VTGATLPSGYSFPAGSEAGSRDVGRQRGRRYRQISQQKDRGKNPRGDAGGRRHIATAMGERREKCVAVRPGPVKCCLRGGKSYDKLGFGCVFAGRHGRGPGPRGFYDAAERPGFGGHLARRHRGGVRRTLRSLAPGNLTESLPILAAAFQRGVRRRGRASGRG